MARITGKNGQVKLGGTVIASIDDWTIDAKIPVADATAMGDQFHVKLSLIREWSATMKLKWEPGVASNFAVFGSAFALATTDGGNQSGKVTLDFYPDAGATEKFSGDAFIDFALKAPVGGVVESDCKAVGTGALTHTP